MSINITVLFDGSFWIGVFEREEKEFLQVAKFTFGQEPRETEVLDFILNDFDKLRFSSPQKDKTLKKELSFKKKQKLIKKTQEEKGIGTKAQNALKLLQEERKIERKSFNKKKNEEEKRLKFLQKQEKKKEKHKGH
ncbi:MAG: YjdF family protein [Fusobacteriaceae bacterium]|nr:YjdF family protein [Fusobacteriaceae bacterium]MBN2838559.1 YjdF family protein [Fusobacteriaceae bacterium]